MDKNIDDLLNFDAFNEAEKVTGKSYKEDKSTEFLCMALHFQNIQDKQKALTQSGDTCFGDSLDRYKAIISEIGFKKVYELNFYSSSSKTEEIFYIYWHDFGVLLVFDTFYRKGVNGGNIYYNWKPYREKFDYKILSSGHFNEDVWIGSDDCREGLKRKLYLLQENGALLKKWKERPFLWLLHHVDSKPTNYDYKKINEERISKLPKEIQDNIVGVV